MIEEVNRAVNDTELHDNKDLPPARCLVKHDRVAGLSRGVVCHICCMDYSWRTGVRGCMHAMQGLPTTVQRVSGRW